MNSNIQRELEATLKEIVECLLKPQKYDEISFELVLNYANLFRIVLFGWNCNFRKVSQKIYFEDMRTECKKIFEQYLTETEKKIVITHFGLDENYITPLELDEIANLMNVPTDEILQEGLNALTKLQYQFYRSELFKIS